VKPEKNDEGEGGRSRRGQGADAAGTRSEFRSGKCDPRKGGREGGSVCRNSYVLRLGNESGWRDPHLFCVLRTKSESKKEEERGNREEGRGGGAGC